MGNKCTGAQDTAESPKKRRKSKKHNRHSRAENINRHIVYSPQEKASKTGHGSVDWDEGNQRVSYTGSFKNNMFEDAQGVLQIYHRNSKNKEEAPVRACGPFRDGKKNGMFSIHFPGPNATVSLVYMANIPSSFVEVLWQNSKTTYKGEIRHGKKEGVGIMEKSDGTKYAGQWEQGLMNGKGTYCYEDGSEYNGEFENDRKNGYGELKLSSGVMYKCHWKDGKPYDGVIISARGKKKKLKDRKSS